MGKNLTSPRGVAGSMHALRLGAKGTGRRRVPAPYGVQGMMSTGGGKSARKVTQRMNVTKVRSSKPRSPGR